MSNLNSEFDQNPPIALDPPDESRKSKRCSCSKSGLLNKFAVLKTICKLPRSCHQHRNQCCCLSWCPRLNLFPSLTMGNSHYYRRRMPFNEIFPRYRVANITKPTLKHLKSGTATDRTVQELNGLLLQFTTTTPGLVAVRSFPSLLGMCW